MRKLVLRLAALAAVAAVVVIPAAVSSTTGTAHYTVAFKGANGLPANVDSLVAQAGGTVIARLPEIGGVGVESSNPNFAAAVAKNPSVLAADVSATAQLIDPPDDVSTQSADNNGGNVSPTGPDDQPMPDPLGYEQWDKKKMDATLTGSYALQQGRPDVRVFVIDTGVDMTHPDIAANLDVAESKSFVPTEPTVQDFNGHGTWTASAVGAPINGIGISGVAPKVTIVSGKVLDGTGHGEFLYTDMALIYAAQKHFDIVSASLGGYMSKAGNADHPDYILLTRATQYARSNGVLPIAALGNDSTDLSDGAFFRNYVEAPAEIAGWVGVSATGYGDYKAWYSNFGMGKTDVSAPGGSTRDYRGIGGVVDCGGHGGICRLIGAWSSTGSASPSTPVESCTGPGGTPPCYAYGYVHGTSMATPNAAGVAALIVSQYGDFSPSNKNKPHMSPTQVEQILQVTANNQPCPEPRTIRQGLLTTFGNEYATCQGDAGYNSFFGKGIVDALNAVTYK